MSIEIVERDFRSFFRVPFEVYPPELPYVSPLKQDLKRTLSDKNPFHERGALTYFTALRGGRPVGRIVAHVYDAANAHLDEQAACFGYFDCEDDAETAAALLERAQAFGRARGCTKIRGNLNLTAAQEMGVLTDHDERMPMVAMVHGPTHIARLLEGAGYEARYPMTTFVNPRIQELDVETCIIDKHRALMTSDEFVFRHLDMRRFEDEVESVRRVINDAMDGNHMFCPISEDEMQFQLAPFKAVVDPRLVRLAETKDGEVIGATLAAPDINPLLRSMNSDLFPLGWLKFLLGRKKLDGVTIIIIVVNKAFQAKGVIGVLNYQLLKAVQAGGYTRLGGTWIADSNKPSLKQTQFLKMEPLHRMDFFEKPLA